MPSIQQVMIMKCYIALVLISCPYITFKLLHHKHTLPVFVTCYVCPHFVDSTSNANTIFGRAHYESIGI